MKVMQGSNTMTQLRSNKTNYIYPSNRGGATLKIRKTIMNKTLSELKDVYDFRSDKFQNFEYQFTVKDKSSSNSRKVHVWATSEMVAKQKLSWCIGINQEL